MQSMAPASAPATHTITLANLVSAFAAVPDPRRAASIRYPLPSMLALAVAAILCAQTSVLAIAEWGARQPRDLLDQLGFAEGQTPCQTTVHRLFQRLDSAVLAQALGTYFQQTMPGSSDRGAQGIAIDGKTQRGRRQFEAVPASVHALTAFCHEQGVILAEEPVEQGTDKAEAELTVAPRVIADLDWHNRVLTGDALYCQRDLCQQILASGGDYLLTVKANQPTLYQRLWRTFLPDARPLLDRRETRTVNKGHGRIEIRHLVATADPLALPDWPGVAQLFQLERIWWEKGHRKQQVRYGITSLPSSCGPPARLLQLRRQHWLIENRSHRTKDVTLGEDASLVHTGQGPAVCSLLRSAALNLLRRAGCHHVAATLRLHSQQPERAVALLLDPLPTHA
jgi:predicted transposase YbfD/YdcC